MVYFNPPDPLLSVLKSSNALLNLAKMPKSGPGEQKSCQDPTFLLFLPGRTEHLVGVRPPGLAGDLLCFRVIFVQNCFLFIYAV